MDVSNINILYVCGIDKATSLQRRVALRKLGLSFKVVFYSIKNEKLSLFHKTWRKVIFRLGFFPERNNENQKIIDNVNNDYFDLIFIEKGLSIKPSTLRYIKDRSPNTILLSYTLDDMLNKHNSSYYYKKAIPLYDYHFTNKSYNLDELTNLGANKVHYFKNSFSSSMHNPIITNSEEKKYYGSDVSFIGFYEINRKESILFLAENNIKIKIWGWGENVGKAKLKHKNILNMGKFVYGKEFSKVICSSKISLCFLRKANRDLETTRSIEIPACGGFMLAERTPEHQSLFQEGFEAEYFSSNQELLEKVKFYLKYESKRDKIAENGRKRCLTSDYSYEKQLSDILKIVFSKGNRNN